MTFSIPLDPILSIYDAVQFIDPDMPALNGNWTIQSIGYDGPRMNITARRGIGDTMKERFEEFVEQAEDTMDAAKSLLPKQAKVVQQTPNGKSVWVRFTGESADRPLTKVPIAINSRSAPPSGCSGSEGEGDGDPGRASTASTISDIAGLCSVGQSPDRDRREDRGNPPNGTVISAQTLRIQSRPGFDSRCIQR